MVPSALLIFPADDTAVIIVLHFVPAVAYQVPSTSYEGEGLASNVYSERTVEKPSCDKHRVRTVQNTTTNNAQRKTKETTNKSHRTFL